MGPNHPFQLCNGRLVGCFALFPLVKLALTMGELDYVSRSLVIDSVALLERLEQISCAQFLRGILLVLPAFSLRVLRGPVLAVLGSLFLG